MQIAFLKDLDMGTVPAWFGGASLILALIIFMRDHSSMERKDVDSVAVWWNIDYTRREPTDPAKAADANIKIHLRNVGNLPVEIRAMDYRISSLWLVRDLAKWPKREDGSMIEPGDLDFSEGAWKSAPGGAIEGHLGRIRIPPSDTVVSGPHHVNLRETAPRHADQLFQDDGVRCEIKRIGIIDNAGRKWEVRPGSGKRSLRIRLPRLLVRRCIKKCRDFRGRLNE